MKKKVVITAGSGFLGRRLTDFLKNTGYEIHHISYTGKKYKDIPSYRWNPEQNWIEEEGRKVLRSSDVVIHLSGANIFGILTESYKKELVNSRVISTQFLCNILNEDQSEQRPSLAIFASAIGYYGVGGDTILTENSQPGKGFFPDLCVQWENASLGLHPQIRKVHTRISFVLDKNEGGFPKMVFPVKLFLGSIPGNGKQYLSWIHIEDLVRIFEFIIEKPDADGVYNLTAPDPRSFEDFYKQIANRLKRPIVLPNTPDFILKMVMGELYDVLIGGSRVMPERLLNQGFSFLYGKLEKALDDLL